MAVDLYLACRECSCAEHTELNARHEVAESLCSLRWSEEFEAKARDWLGSSPDFGLQSAPAKAILGFAEVHRGHTLGIVGADDLFAFPWRQERAPLPSRAELEETLGAKKKAEREEAVRLARYRDAPELIEPLLRVLAKDRALSVRAEAATSLASLANSQQLEGEALQPILEALGAALAQPKPAARAAAALALGLLVSGRPGEVDVYNEAIERAESCVDEVAGLLEGALEAEGAPRVELLQALGRCARPRSAGVILAHLRAEEAAVQQAATQALRRLANSGGLGPAFADELLGLAEAALAEDASLRVQQSWGQVLGACGPVGVAALKRLYRTRGLCFFAAQAALCGGAPRRDPLVGQDGRVPRRRAGLAPEHLRFLPAASGAQSGNRPASFFELDLAGKLLAAQRADGLSVIWDLSADRIVRELWHEPDLNLRRRDPAKLIALSPSGETLATGTLKGQVRLWSVATGERLRELQVEGCSRLRFGTEGERLYVGTPGGVLAYEGGSGRLARRYPEQHTCDVVAARLDPEGERIATCGRTGQRRPDPRVHVMRRNGEHLLTLEHEEGVLDLAWSPCGTKVATLDAKRQLSIWSGEGERLSQEGTSAGKRLAWPEPEAIVVSGGGPRLTVHRGETRVEEGAHGVSFAGEGKRWVCAGTRGEAVLEEPGREPRALDTGSGAAALACRAGLVASLSRDGKESSLRWWTGDEPPREVRVPDPTAYQVSISPEGARLAVMSQSWVLCYEAASGEELWRRQGKFYELGSLEFGPRGEELLVPSKEDALSRAPGWVEVLDAASGETRARLGGIQGAGAFEVTKRHLVTGGAWPSPRGQVPLAGSARVWDLASGAALRVLRDEREVTGPAGQESRHVSAASLAPGGRVLASAGRDEVIVWDLEEEAPRWEAKMSPALGRAQGLSFDAQGELLAVGTSRDHVLVFEVASGRELLRVGRAGEPRGFPPAIAPRFLPDGRLVWGRLQLEVFDLPAALAEGDQVAPEPAAELPAVRRAEPKLWAELEGDVSGLAAGEEVLIAASGEGDLVAFELGSLTGAPQERWRQRPFPRGVRALALSPSGTWLACAGWGGELEVFDAASGERLQSLERGPTWVTELGFLGEDYVWGVQDPGAVGMWNPNPIRVWDLASGEHVLATTGTCATSAGERFVVGARESRFNAPLFSEDPLEGQSAKRNRVPAPVALFEGRSLRWRRNLELPRPLGGGGPPLPEVGPHESHGGQQDLALSPDGRRLAVARAEPGLFDLVLLELGPEGESCAQIVQSGLAELLSWRGDGRALAFARGGVATVVDLTGSDTNPFAVQVEGATALTWVGERLLVGTEEGRLWSLG